jgi:hypothetical protein
MNAENTGSLLPATVIYFIVAICAHFSRFAAGLIKKIASKHDTVEGMEVHEKLKHSPHSTFLHGAIYVVKLLSLSFFCYPKKLARVSSTLKYVATDGRYPK